MVDIELDSECLLALKRVAVSNSVSISCEVQHFDGLGSPNSFILEITTFTLSLFLSSHFNIPPLSDSDCWIGCDKSLVGFVLSTIIISY